MEQNVKHSPDGSKARIFETSRINGLELRNRFVRSATWEGMATADGRCTKALTELNVRLARGGVGLIISSHTCVSPEGLAGPRRLAIYHDRFISGLHEMTEAVHDAGGNIVLQIAHAGCQADTAFSGLPAIGPSGFVVGSGAACREMTTEDIRRVVDDFGKAARRARSAGFDGIQIHGAHGYLVGEFLSPFFNKRTDDYGGNREIRTRIVLEVLQRILEFVGNDFPVMIKLNSSDFLVGGLTVDDMLEALAILENQGIDAVELCGGTAYSGAHLPIRVCKPSPEGDDVFYLDAARKYKKRSSTPLMLVGGIRSFSVAEALVKENLADYVSLSRPLICEPEFSTAGNPEIHGDQPVGRTISATGGPKREEVFVA